ncbi:adenylate/guanylate cyclase domain-containing protein [Roseofilum sp. Guam]|uniref:adenylate/guanylate cyclase domain-containing protein n=1 Tax=Roseofilum sp. Guam TaxID=2821502 RepID=UPI001B2E5104|nr:adenylate/guanylate cyclase domain-containing protein [Roseofilum sp. Guam]MBP0027433.1 adenylate/guanylate cyclase domain-containing protein [Roseofilum sp. Guam]
MRPSTVSVNTPPYLVLKTPSSIRHLSLAGNQCWTIGRTQDNTVVLSDPWISRNHAMIQHTDTGTVYLIDLGSRNGTFVNGRRVNVPVTLQDGDHLMFGQTEAHFHDPLAVPDPTLDLEDVEENSHVTAALHVRRLISVMVVDIRNFTGLTQQMDDVTLSTMMGNWFRNVGKILRKYDSWVDKYIGDAVMAVWFHGTEGVNQMEVMKMLYALNQLHQMTQKFAKEYPLPSPMRIGAGVNTGYAMVGNTGSGDRPDYTALGDTVNAAFRLESCTKQIQKDIALGKTTYQYLFSVGTNPTLFEKHMVQLKGYEHPAVTYGCSFSQLQAFLLKSPKFH